MRIKPTNFKLGIGFPCSWSHVPFDTFLSIIKMQKPDFELIPATNGPVDGLRNHIVEHALRSGCTHLLMMDMDQTYPEDLIPRLLSHSKEIVGCLIHRRYPPFDPLIYKGSLGAYDRIEEYQNGELIEVDATGTGCLLFNMKVFKSMPAPWFRFRTTEDGRPIGEDFGFCSDLRHAGYRIYVDTSVKCGHLSLMNVTEGTYNLYKAMLMAKKKEKQKWPQSQDLQRA